MAERSLHFTIVGPAGFATDPHAVDRAVERLEARGHRVRVDATARSRWQRFSARDDERLAAITRVTADADTEVALMLRGGYGFTRLADRIDFSAVAAARKRWIGHSDFTAFQLAALASAGMTALPDAIFVIDVGYHKIAVTEAKKLGIPIVAVVDTNHNPDPISYIIPGNDDSSRAIRLYARGVADAVLEGKSTTIQEIVASGDEFVEVADEAPA